MHEFSYLYGVLSVGAVWALFFLIRPDLRRTMLMFSIMYGVAALVVEYFSVLDWWRPQTVTGTAVGIEAFLFGIFFGGACSVCYEVIFAKSGRVREQGAESKPSLRYLLLAAIGIILFGRLILGLHSALACILSFASCTLFILIRRPDLTRQALTGAVFGVLLAALFFGVPEFINSGWIESAWLLDNLSGYFIFQVPVEDVVWFVFCSAFTSVIHHYWKNREAVG